MNNMYKRCKGIAVVAKETGDSKLCFRASLPQGSCDHNLKNHFMTWKWILESLA